MTTTASSGGLSPGSANDRTAFGGLSAKLLSPCCPVGDERRLDNMCPTSRWGRSAKYSVDGDRPCNVMVPRSLVMLAGGLDEQCLHVLKLLLGDLTHRGSSRFVGWFGPRGLASVVFGLLALEALAGPVAKPAVTVIAFTVLLSVLAHGLSADPLAKRYGPRLIPPPGAAGPAGLAEIPERRLIRRSPACGASGVPGGR